MCLQEFSRKYPGIIVDLTYVSHGEPLQSEVDDPYDFHFHYLDMIPDSEEYEIRETHTTQLCFVSPKTAHTDMAKPDDSTDFVDGLDLSSLPHQKFILISEEENPILYMQIMNYCQTHRFTPQIANRFSDIKSVLLSVGSGLGISILPLKAAEILSALPQTGIHVTPIDDESYAITCAVAWKKSLLNPAAELFLQIIEEHLE